MDIIQFLIYKDTTQGKRISKTKIISISIFILFYLLGITFYLSSPIYSSDIAVILIAPIILGLIFAVPAFIIGWLISKFLYKNETRNVSNNNQQQHYNYQNTNDISYSDNQVLNNKNMDVNRNNLSNVDSAKKFKNSIERNDSEYANQVLNNWNNNDANYWYAKIIFEGMPPSVVTLNELNTWLNRAEDMNSFDESLQSWFRETALKVIKMNQ